MEQIETQVSDLRYLTQVPVPLPGDRDEPDYSPPASATPGDNSALGTGQLGGDGGAVATPGSAKRPADDDEIIGGKRQRSKRNRYISIACNECKRRKIKCNGETPCQRCNNLNLSCLYAPNCCSSTFKDSEEYKKVTVQMTRLQEQVDGLIQSVSAMRNDNLRLAPIQDRSMHFQPANVSPSPSTSLSSLNRPELAPPKTSSFRGPTSTAFSLNVATTTIQNMGYKSAGDGAEDGPVALEDAGVLMRRPPETPAEPLWGFDKDELVRLCGLHEEEVGIMYPVVNIQTVILHAREISALMEAERPRGVAFPLNDDRTLLLKMVMCCALAVEEHGQSERARQLYDSMEAELNRKLMAEPSSVANLPLLALLAGYRFLTNDEILSWRVMGQVARLCLELGIHRATGIQRIQNEEERRNALNSFWSAYVLDRRWAFGTGLPFVVQDDEIDPDLPQPEDYPYLVAMITYSRLGAKVWRYVSHFGPVLAQELKQEGIQKLDQEILQWYDGLPEEAKLHSSDKEKPMTATSSYDQQRLRIWTYLRFNQIRIWLYTPVLHSATSIAANTHEARRVVDLARDTIRYLTRLNNTTNLYRKIQVFYNQFLASAIAAVFLASVHAPVQFSAACRDEFYMALELVRDLSAKSWVSKRLWRTISSLKEVGPRVGLGQPPPGLPPGPGPGPGPGLRLGPVLEESDRRSSAALTMAGLASGRVARNPGGAAGPSPLPPSPYRHSVPAGAPQLPQPGAALGDAADNGLRIRSEMVHIFEDFVSMNGLPPLAEEGVAGGLPTPDSISHPSGAYSNGNVFHHFREMF